VGVDCGLLPSLNSSVGYGLNEKWLIWVEHARKPIQPIILTFNPVLTLGVVVDRVLKRTITCG
jgi:hypothetical protein